MTDSRIWVLGAPDPEMEMIERTLRECGETVVYATTGDGERVTPATAYRCTVPEVPEGATVYAVECIDALPDGWVRIDHHRPGDPGYGRPPSEFLAASSIGQVVAELARLDMLPGRWPRHGCVELPVVGRYREWGPCAVTARRQFEGACCPDAVCACVPEPQDTTWGIELRDRSIASVPQVLALCAAADHCLGAAYRGECPGVDPDAARGFAGAYKLEEPTETADDYSRRKPETRVGSALAR